MNRFLPSLEALSIEQRFPLLATIELNAGCNLQCPHCYVPHSRRSALTLEVLDDLFSQMADAGTMRVGLTGGEIALRPDLFEIIAAARSRYLDVCLYSSGTLWDAHDWQQIASLGVRRVRLSLYATEAQMHDQCTASPGSLDKTMATLHGLRARGVEVAIGCTIMRENTEYVPGVVELADRLGIEVSIDANIFDRDDGDTSPARSRATPDQIARVYSNSAVRALWQPIDPSCKAAGDGRPCSTGEFALFIRSDGNTVPCVMWPGGTDNILTQRYIEIFRESSTFCAARNVRLAHFTGCSDCAAQPGCGQCAAMNLQSTGSVARPSPTVCATTEGQLRASRQRVATSKEVLPIIDSATPQLQTIDRGHRSTV